MGNSITPYHGSSYDFDIIDLHQSRSYKDFGQGFYTSADSGQAKSMAERNAQMRKSKLQRFDSGNKIIWKWLYQYQFDAAKAASLSVKEFTEANNEWAKV
jgi:CRISPR/Cas system-associated protein Cas10 (large subunit of type III CRISPR-Cas system)